MPDPKPPPIYAKEPYLYNDDSMPMASIIIISELFISEAKVGVISEFFIMLYLITLYEGNIDISLWM